ncbi:MAG: universal stress protein [Bacteroidetes bacterium]|nr:universal stress protein [Bacteroidota bacterium]
MKNILLPTDFSDNSRNAIEYAMLFFKNWECNFYILNVQKQSEFILDDLMTAPSTASVHSAIAKDNKKELQEFAATYRTRYKKEKYTFTELFDFDSLGAAVRQAVSQHQIDLIIMGTNGATGAKEVLFGSNTLSIIRSIHCPILTIPEGYKFNTLQKALFSTHNCEDFSEKGIQIFKELINIHQPELHILDLMDPSKDLKHSPEGLKKIFTGYQYTHYPLHTALDPVAINIATQLLKVDIHAVFIEKKSLLERMFLGSNTSKLSYNTTIPLLFLKR